MKKLILLALIAVMSLWLAGCEDEEEAVEEKVDAAMDEAAGAVEEAAAEADAAMAEVEKAMGDELTNEDLASIFVGVFPDDPGSETALALYDKMGTDADTVMNAFEELEEDEERLSAVSALVHKMDEEKGAAFDDEFNIAQ